jgi:hypothetical protein
VVVDALASPPIVDPPGSLRRRQGPQETTDAPRPRPWRTRSLLLLAVGPPLVLGLVHVAVVARHYFVGSFDDDASYIMAAKSLGAGHGLSATLPSGAVLAGAYPPGYPALLVPLASLWPNTFAPMRLLSVACFAALFPLTWAYLSRRRLSIAARIAVLWLLALNPVVATYGSMVMAEAPFLAGFVVLLLLCDRWDALEPLQLLGGRRPPGEAGRDRLVVAMAVGIVAAAEVWLKEAAVGMVAGLALWQLWRRRSRRAVWVVGITVALLLPVAIARAVAGVPVAGSRYSQELGAYYSGGLAGRLVHVFPKGLWHTVTTALPASVVPYLTPLPLDRAWVDVWKVLSVHVSILVVIGAVSWWRNHRDSATLVVGLYLVETLLWPYINERRIVLVLPVVLAWYVLGAQAVWRWGKLRIAAVRGTAQPVRFLVRGASVCGASSLVAAAVVVPLAFQFPRDYLYAFGQDSSHPQGSRYVTLLAQVGRPSDVVETDYESTVALFTGHRTANGAFVADLNSCDPSRSAAALAADNAGFLLVGDLNKPGWIDNGCLAGEASGAPWAAPLLHTARDDATVYELVGPGTGHPGLRDVSKAAVVTASSAALASSGAARLGTAARPGTGWVEWRWAGAEPVSQVSVDRAAAGSTTTAVSVQLEEPGKGWVRVASTRSAVGDAPGDVPYLLATLPPATKALAARVVVEGSGGAQASGLTVVGPGGDG